MRRAVMVGAAALSAALLPGQAGAEGLACTFTMVCSPLSDCQSHPGVPFAFDVVSGAFRFLSGTEPVFGTPLEHIDPPDIAVLFEAGGGSTLLLTVAGAGEAVLTQQDLTASGGVQSVSYFGTCEPAA